MEGLIRGASEIDGRQMMWGLDLLRRLVDAEVPSQEAYDQLCVPKEGETQDEKYVKGRLCQQLYDDEQQTWAPGGAAYERLAQRTDIPYWKA